MKLSKILPSLMLMPIQEDIKKRERDWQQRVQLALIKAQIRIILSTLLKALKKL